MNFSLHYSPNNDKGHPNLLKLYITSSIFTIIIIPIIVGSGVFSIFRHNIINHAVKDSKKVGNELIKNHFSFLTSVDSIDRFTILPEKIVKRLNTDIRDEIERYHMMSKIVKIKLYSKNKQILYSNDNSIIGRIDDHNHTLEKALQGVFSKESSKKGEVLDFEDELKFNVNLVETYMPIENFDGAITGAIELYFDISGDKKEIRKVIMYSSVSAFIFLFFLFGGMFIILHKTNIAQEKAKHDAQLANKQRLLDGEIYQHSTVTAVGELAASIAHQVNNPITVALTRMGYIDKKTDSFKKFGDLKDDFQAIKTQIENVGNIMKMILHGSKHWTYSPQHIFFSDIISRVTPMIELRIKDLDIKISASIEPTDLSLEADPVFLEQILINILNNAVDAIIEKDKTGVISILCYSYSNHYVCMEITDNGIGIKQENIDNIFNSFYSTKTAEKGTGLGLSIAQRLIERHEGRIEVESEYQSGSHFKIILPKNDDSKENL